MFEKNRSMQYSFFLRWTCTKQCLHPPVKVAVLGVDISVWVMLQAQDPLLQTCSVICQVHCKQEAFSSCLLHVNMQNITCMEGLQIFRSFNCGSKIQINRKIADIISIKH